MVGPKQSLGALTRFAAALAVAGPMFLSIGASGLAPAFAAVADDQSALDSLVIVTHTGRHVFRVETARTESQRETGLMYRRSLPADRGMIFDFDTPQSVMMWMKNTYVPLDMIFMSRAGVVTHIAHDAEPLSEKIIASDGPAYAVLEVDAGTADKIGLQVGDKVENALFDH